MHYAGEKVGVRVMRLGRFEVHAGGAKDLRGNTWRDRIASRTSNACSI